MQERAEVAEAQAALEEKSDDEILADLALPNPDDMQSGDDFSAFLKAAVPERLRRRALRKLWLTNPTLANVDGLVDYGEDFTDSATVVEGMQTAYQVGKGMLKHLEEIARQAEAAAEVVPEHAPEDIEDAEVAPVLAEVEETAPADLAFVETVFDPEEVAPTPRRRMRFEFEQPMMERP